MKFAIKPMLKLARRAAARLAIGPAVIRAGSLALALVFASAFAAALSGCDSPDVVKSQSYIQKEIDIANHCDTADDCADAGGRCPFGCFIYVNKAEVEHIRDLVSSYESECEYSCIMCTDVKCIRHRCEVICG